MIDTMCLVKKMNLVTTHHRFIANITSTIAQFLQAYFDIHDATCKILATAVPSDLGLTAVPGIHTNPNPAEFISMFAGININNCVFQFSQNPVHGMPSSMTANTDNDNQAPELKRRPSTFRICTNSFRIQTFFITLS